ncbi:DUF4064 domain-containing protein [Metabacillus sp. GX 13764]|uniref:DUF4064 domain-containing protein n=1 Tax=Metabacillus kandeliae TaxID=2900151 RepID=UPI001E50BDCA|nr:DUF4064 domain-containing protein [Metabacillus kandeliae]MCD7033949.1 DUF4064 domain-containing protein [Metabacillus kandeliae]
MKRTLEIVFSIIGAVLFALTSFLGFFFLAIKNIPDLEAGLNQALAEDPELAASGLNYEMVQGMLQTGAVVILTFSIIGLAAGIIAAILLKGNKKPKTAGIILIAAAVICGGGTFLAGGFASICYLIAGIAALARKPKATEWQEEKQVL